MERKYARLELASSGFLQLFSLGLRTVCLNGHNNEETNTVVLNVGGLTDNEFGADEFVDWIKKPLTIGSTITIKIIESNEWDEPAERKPRDSDERIARAKAYYEQLKATSNEE